MFDVLEKLHNIPSPSGFEENIKEFILKEAKPNCDKIFSDVLGNIVVRKAGKGPKIMLCAHMDEIGLISTFIEDNGFVRFSVLGSPELRSLAGKSITFLNGVKGVIGFEGKCELKDYSYKKCFIDIGAGTKEEAEKAISIGTAAVIDGNLSEINGKIIGRALDDKIGVFILLEVMKRIAGSPNDLYFVFTVQEELGLRGAKTAAFQVEPDYCISLDVTAVGDLSTGNDMEVSLGKGPAIKIKDKGIICHKFIVNTLIDTAKKADISYQLEVLEKGSTDAGAVHLTKSGVISGGLSIPARYIHTPNEMVDKGDIENAIKMLIFLLEKGI